MARLVVALGGNALGNTPEEQKENIGRAASALVQLILDGHKVIVSHGNGPQVGMIKLAFEESSAINRKVPSVNLPECAAMSQGYIGYHLQSGLTRELRQRGINREVGTVITQVVVSASDPAFENPEKPIGGYYDEQTARVMMEAHPEQVYADDAGRGWRRVVPSPKPIDIVEKETILDLVNHGFIVIACGGGGVPVVVGDSGGYEGVAAVIDKDLASEKLAELVEADYLVMLTAVDRVCIRWGQPNQEELGTLTVEEAERYCSEGQFAPGSMLPKVQAAMLFAQSGKHRKAIIASLEKASLAVSGESGTVIARNTSELATGARVKQ